MRSEPHDYLSFFQKPTKLNVLKNDKDSWDYTKDPCSSISGFTSKLIKALTKTCQSIESFCSIIACKTKKLRHQASSIALINQKGHCFLRNEQADRWRLKVSWTEQFVLKTPIHSVYWQYLSIRRKRPEWAATTTRLLLLLQQEQTLQSNSETE